MKNRQEELAEKHWIYTANVIELENGIPENDLQPKDITIAIQFDEYLRRIKFYYTQAFIHGYKHGLEDADRKVYP